MNKQTDHYANPRIDRPEQQADAAAGSVYADPAKIVWVGSMFFFGTIGSALTFSPSAFVLFLVTTGTTLCLGHSLGMHRRFIHRAYNCPRWMEYLFVHFGVLVGLAGPFGMLRTHDLRDWAQRQAECHSYFSHKEVWYRDFWWQLFCSIRLERSPVIEMEPEIANDKIHGPDGKALDVATSTVGNTVLRDRRLGLVVLGYLQSREYFDPGPLVGWPLRPQRGSSRLAR